MIKTETIIIGTGFSGIASAIKLKKSGIEDFILLERDNKMGGTWVQNTYPGAAVDVQSHLYSFSFEPYPWTRFFAKQEEIMGYTNFVIQKHNLQAKTTTNAEVIEIRYSDVDSTWTTTLKNGETYVSKFIINCSGTLSQPIIPKFTGLDSYKGAIFHSARWDHTCDYKGKRVAVIGTGASSVQIIPTIADQVSSLHVYQKDPEWIIPRPDRKFSPFELKLLKYPLANWLLREKTYWSLETRILGLSKFPKIMDIMKKVALRHIAKQVKDPVKRELLTPKYPLGCRRVLLSNTYLKTMGSDSVKIITDGVDSIHENGIVTGGGEKFNYDVIVCSTGFFVADGPILFNAIGRDGVTLKEEFKNDMHAYVGATVPNFPNLFLIGGPNTSPGHTSAIHFIESAVRFTVNTIKYVKETNSKSVEVKREVETAYNVQLQKQLSTTVWAKGCGGWYTTKAGKITTIYPDYSFIFRYKNKFRKEDYNIA